MLVAKRKLNIFFSLFRFLMFFFIMAIIILPIWLCDTFGANILFESILFHILIDPQNLIETNQVIAKSFLYIVILLPVIIALIFELLIILLAFKKNNFNNYIKLLNKKNTILEIVIIAVIISGFSIGATQYFCRGIAGKDKFSSIYTTPKIAVKYNSPKKNLIIIYFESLEQNLTNLNNNFGVNLIKPIDDLPGITVKKFVQAPGTGCTIAAMVASQCAIPLKIPYLSRYYLKHINHFLPNVICLGDILASQHYEQYFFIGSNLKFAGVGKFYRNHGYQYLYGLQEFMKTAIDRKILKGWSGGLNDDTLLEKAYEHILKLEQANKSFNVVIVTTDTHYPNGTPAISCRDSEKNSGFMGAYQCSARLVADFVAKLQKAGVLKNTVLIITGDHLFQNSAKQKKYFSEPRYIYFKIVGENFKKKPTRATMTHFDIAPTILELLGLKLPKTKKFGLGMSIFATASQKQYEELLSSSTKTNILNPSKIYDSFWYAN
jgi:phosphoglycerol transferase